MNRNIEISKYRNLPGQRGTTLIEGVFYIFVLTLMFGAIIGALVSLSRSYRSIQSAQNVETTAEVSLDRIVREIRDATSIDIANSTLGSSPGVLTLNTTDVSGNATTIQFYASSSRVRVKEAGVDIGPLTPSAASVTSLIFRTITTAQSQGVKIEMTVTSGTGTAAKTKKFYASAIERGSYPLQ